MDMDDIVDTSNIPLQVKPSNKLDRIAKRPPVNIEFQDLTYSVRDARVKGGWRQLLRSINGKFLSGELTAIMGPSGAGKSTLLNILAGYVAAGVKGSIKINDRPREMKIFNKLSTYIMQEDIVQPRLTVREAMIVAARLKLGSRIGQNEKVDVVDEVIQLLGLQSCTNTRSEFLSGGQRKRLAIAVDLVNNPPVIFLDEPTTGLDNYAIKQCMDLLQKLTKQGRTVICTIHQPPASLFQNFHQVYVLANGYCVYNGTPDKLVPFLSLTGCACPQYYSPADYIIEIVHANTDSISTLSNAIQNGKTNMRASYSNVKEKSFENSCEIYCETTEAVEIGENINFPLSYAKQTTVLLSRMFMQMIRNKSMLYIQFFHHLISGLLLGGIFIGTGNDATQAVAIFKYVISVSVFFMYTYVMAPVLLFPLEVRLLRREYFNRWYSLKAYYTALTVATIPMPLVLTIMFLLLVYFLTGQPINAERFMYFCFVGLSLAFCSQGLGYAIGSLFSCTSGSVVAPSVLATILAVAIYGMGYRNGIEPVMKFFMLFSYLRYGLVAFCQALFSNREKLNCPDDEIYCHYENPKTLLIDMGMADQLYINQICGLLLFTIIFRVLGYLALRYRMSSELKNKVVYYASKIIRQKE